MPQKFISITNFEKYQTSTPGKEGRPWVKLYKKILSDPEFMKLSTHSRFLYTGLILLADDCNNKIYNCRTYLGQRLYIPPTEIDLKPLYRAGFLEASNLSRTLSEERRVEKNRVEGEARHDAPRPPNVLTLTKGKRPIREDDAMTEKHRAFALTLKIDPGPEWGKFKNYCLANDRRYANFEAAFRNWLARAAELKGERRVL